MDQEKSSVAAPSRTYSRQSIVPNSASEVHRLSIVANNTLYTPFKAHASLSRVKSDDPWGIKQATGVHPYQQNVIAEEADSEQGPDSQSSRGSQHVNTVPKPNENRASASAYAPVQESTNCCSRVGRRINIDWLFFIKPMGILMVLEIGIGAIAVVCGDFGSLFQGAWKSWFLMWSLIIITCTAVLFLLHLCRLGRGDLKTKMIFLLAEIIYDVMAALSLLLSAVAYLRVSVDPNTSRSYSLSVVIIAGVCGIIASIMYGISAFLTFTIRRNYKFHGDSRHRSFTLNLDPELNDDEEYEHFKMRGSPKKSTAVGPSKRIISNQGH